MAIAQDHAARTPAARRLKSSGRSWTAAEKEKVRRLVADCQSRGLPLTEAFREVAQALSDRSPAAVAMLYYNVLRREDPAKRTNGSAQKAAPEAPPAPAVTAARPLQITGDLVEAFEGLPEYIARLHRRLDELEAAVQALPAPTLGSLARWAEGVASALNAAAQLEARLAALEEERRRLLEENERLHTCLEQAGRRLAEVETAYHEARELYEMFTNMASISQIMSLGDFKQRMKTTLDRWGSVLKVEFEPAAAVLPAASPHQAGAVT